MGQMTEDRGQKIEFGMRNAEKKERVLNAD
jgi:hypothetical protein